ncbi:hypothetical protein B0H13DRAFT_2668785 [Mycena leptocephala]|nr:hypothetical protein B0H13DRAFT_2668785 [Mycena leptocephala]
MVPQNAEETTVRIVKRRGWNAFKDALNALNAVSDVFPLLKAPIGGLLFLLDKIDKVSDKYDDWTAMATRIEALSTIIAKYQGDSNMRGRTDGVTEAIEQQARLIQAKQERVLVDRILDESSDAHDIVDSLRSISFLVDVFQIDMGLHTSQVLNQLTDDHDLQKLQPVFESRYDTADGRECMAGTRVSVLAQLLAWATDPDGPSVYWLNGMAGAGKSAIARSFARLLDSDLYKLLGASFFCSRASETRSRVNRIIPTIAYQLACRSKTYEIAVVDVLKNNRDRSLVLCRLQEQFTKLIIPSSAAEGTYPTLVVIIDALDECSDNEATRDFLKTLLRSNHSGIKFFLTSRPEIHIQEELVHQYSFRLHDIEADIVTSDVRRYVDNELSTISRRIEAPGWPSLAEIASLTRLAGPSFIFAFTVVNYLSQSGLVMEDRRIRLHDVLVPPPGITPGDPDTSRTGVIDRLYTEIFATASKGKENREILRMRTALETVVCAQEPLSIAVISALTNAGHKDTGIVLAPFRSVMDIPHSADGPIHLFHASFAEYVTDTRRSHQHALDARHRHLLLTVACLQHMNNNLRRNMLINDRFIAVSSSEDRDTVIPAGVKYACSYWASHLALAKPKTTDGADIISSLKRFVETHLLHWLECLSIVGKLDVAGACLKRAISSLPESRDTSSIITIMNEGRRMVPQIFDFVCENPTEVYHSTQWLPLSSKLRELYGHESPAYVLWGVDCDWGACEQTLLMLDGVKSLEFSRDGSQIVAGSDSGIRIWDVATGDSHDLDCDEKVLSVAFWPDGSRIVSGSSEGTVKIWNVMTGEEERVFSGHSDRVNSVAVSPDGLFIVSGSKDKTVKLWNVATNAEQRTLVGHRARVTSVAFSSNGSYIVSGSWDLTVRIWSLTNGEETPTVLRHPNRVQSVALSPDGSRIAAGSGRNSDGPQSDENGITIWNFATGEVEHKLLGHVCAHVASVAFSPDGTRIASGYWDGAVVIWNVQTEEKLHTFNHLSMYWVSSVSFSPDGGWLASGSGDVRIWTVTAGGENLKHRDPTESEAAGFTSFSQHQGVISLALSPDGSHLVSSHQDKTARIWDVATGEEQCRFTGHFRESRSVAFSPDGSHVVCGWMDNIVQTWNAATGEEEHTLAGHSNAVQCIAFSPEGSHVASGSFDHTVKIWNVATGEEEHTLSGHSTVMCVAFSPDGSRVVSGFPDSSVRIWNIGTGEEEQNLAGHTAVVLKVAFSPDGFQIVSGSNDETVRIWNVASKEEEKTLVGFFEPIPLFTASSMVAPGLFPGNFFILDAHAEAVYLAYHSSDRRLQCVGPYTSQSHNHLCMWADYQNGLTALVLHGTRACLGYKSGRIVVADLASKE